MDDDDDFDFSDHDLDDLPDDALQHLEANAIRATQHQPQLYVAPQSDYGLDDGDEVVNLNDAGPQYSNTHHYGTEPVLLEEEHDAEDVTVDDYGNGDGNAHGEQLYDDYMQVEQRPVPPRSQADPSQLLQRIKKVGSLCPA